MGSFRKVNLIEPELKKILKQLELLNGAKVEFSQTRDGATKVKITIPGQKSALLLIWFTPNGATIQYKTGKNPQLSEKIAKQIVDECGFLEDKDQSFEGITPESLGELKQYLQDLDIKIIKEEKNAEDIYRLSWHSGQKLTVHYYPTKHKLRLTGKKNRIFDEINIWYTSLTSQSVEEAIKLIFSDFKQIKTAVEQYPENLLVKEIKRNIGDVYHKLNDREQWWLQMSVYLLGLHKDLPDFYPTISSSLKLVEGCLKRVLFSKFQIYVPRGRKGFGVAFDSDGNFRTEKTRRQPTSRQKIILERCYKFIADKRNEFQHADIVNSSIVDRSKAEAIIVEVYDIVTELYKAGLL